MYFPLKPKCSWYIFHNKSVSVKVRTSLILLFISFMWINLLCRYFHSSAAKLPKKPASNNLFLNLCGKKNNNISNGNIPVVCRKERSILFKRKTTYNDKPQREKNEKSHLTQSVDFQNLLQQFHIMKAIF